MSQELARLKSSRQFVAPAVPAAEGDLAAISPRAAPQSVNAWRSVTRLIANTHRFIDGARAAIAATQEADTGARLSELERFEVSKVAAAARSRLRVEQLPLLVCKLTEGLEPQLQLAVAQRSLEAMPLEAQVHRLVRRRVSYAGASMLCSSCGMSPTAQVPVTADLLSSFSEAQLRALTADLGQDNDGSDCLERLKGAVVAQPAVSLSRHFQTASPRLRLDHLEMLSELLSTQERSALLTALDAVPAMASPSKIPEVGVSTPSLL